jgi:hypothetical protein
VSIYFLALAALMFGTIAPSFTASDSLFRATRSLLIIAVYPLFLVMVATHGSRVAGLTWISLAAVGLALELIADATSARPESQSLLRTLGIVAVAWPLSIPATIESFLIQLGLVPAPAAVHLPDPPRGAALVGLSDDDMLIAAHQILSGQSPLTAEERTILVAESFNREVHGGGFLQWFSNTDSSVPETVQSLRAVGAERTADLLEHAAGEVSPSWSAAQPFDERRHTLEAAESTFRSLNEAFFRLERQEDLTSLIAEFLRKYRSRCPALDTARDAGTARTSSDAE